MKEIFSMTIYDDGKVNLKWENRGKDIAIPARALGCLYHATMKTLLQEKVITENEKKRVRERLIYEFYDGMISGNNQGREEILAFKNYKMHDEQEPPRARRRF